MTLSDAPVMAHTPIIDHQRCPAWTWFTYPHSNGFLADGRSLILGSFAGEDTVLLRHDLASGRSDELVRLPGIPGKHAARWYDISLRGDRLITVVDNRILAIDLSGDGRLREIHRTQPGHEIHELPAISGDGRRLIVGEILPVPGAQGVTTVKELEIDSGQVTTLFSHAWHCNHFHYCPADESWIGYSHEGPTDRIPDRMWAWHRTLAPRGRCVFDQVSDVPGIPLCIGHERWMYHRPGAVAVAYGVSPHGPRGIWEISVDGTPPRLISAGERDLHVNVNRTGTQVVIDTSGSLACAGSGWQNNDERCDILLADVATGERSWLARTDISGLRFPGRMRHPFHPHPHFAPDGRTVVFNDYAGPDGLPSVSIIRF